MAGPQDIQRYPTGLIDLLGMRATGQTPTKLGDAVSPGMDLTDFYLWDRRETLVGQSPVAIGAVGFLAFSTGATTIPQNELWVLYDCSLRLPPIAAATAITLNMVVQRNAAGTSAWFPITDQLVLPASTGGLIGFKRDEPLLLQPGDVFGTYCSAITGAPGQQAFSNVSFARLKL
jgi:hypothetical protein